MNNLKLEMIDIANSIMFKRFLMLLDNRNDISEYTDIVSRCQRGCCEDLCAYIYFKYGRNIKILNINRKHHIFMYNGLYYDSIARKGVKTINEIDMFKGKEITDIHRWSVDELPSYYFTKWRELKTLQSKRTLAIFNLHKKLVSIANEASKGMKLDNDTFKLRADEWFARLPVENDSIGIDLKMDVKVKEYQSILKFANSVLISYRTYQKSELDKILKSYSYLWAIDSSRPFPITMSIFKLIDGLSDGWTLKILDAQIHYSKKIIPIAHMLRFLLKLKELYTCTKMDKDWCDKVLEVTALYKLYSVPNWSSEPIEDYERHLIYIDAGISKVVELFLRYKDEVNEGLKQDGEIK